MADAPDFQLVRGVATAVPVPTLDESQQRVVDHAAGPLLVLAGPGTGKTTTLVEAVVERVEQRGLRPEQVLVLTFSRKAAAELRARISARLGRTTRGPAAWTFHSFCYALVRRYDDEAGEARLRLLSGPEQFLHVRRLLRGDAEQQPERWPADLRPILRTRGFAEEVRDVLLRAQERGMSPRALEEVGAEHDRPEWRAAASFYQDYLDVLAFEHALDYAGLVQRAGDLLDDPAVLAVERSRFAAVFVDEYQDTDPAQERLLQRLAGAGGDLVVVGDPDQSIYGFRGAEVDGLLGFADRFLTADRRPAPVLTLGVSRRAGAALLEGSRAVAVRIPAPGLPGSALRAHRRLTPVDGGAPGEIELVSYSSPAQEAMGIADRLRRAHLVDGVPWGQMAVLVRSGRRTIPTLRRALVAAGVPVAVAGDEIPLADDPAVTPLLLMLRCALAPERIDDDAAESLLTALGGADAMQLRRLRRTLRASERAARGRRPSGHLLVEAVRDPRAAAVLPADVRRPVEQVARLLATARAAIERGETVERVLWDVWEPSVLRARLERQARGDGSVATAAARDLDAVIALFETAGRFVDQLPKAGAGLFLEDLDAQEIPAGGLAERPSPVASVRLLTAHRSKGLEWDVVVVAGVQEGQWPDLRRRGSLLGAELLRDVGRAGPLVAPPSSAQLVEERRLFYVAVTRARRRLVVTSVDSGDDGGDRPSRFVGELGRPVPERVARSPHVLSLRSLVGEVRHALAAPDSSPALREQAAATLAALAAAGPDGRPVVAAAHPDTWWGVRERSDPGRPIAPPDQPVRVSPSEVATFDTCPLQWFLERRAGVETQAGERQSFGNVLHAIAQVAAQDPERATDEAMLAMLDEVWPELEFEAAWYAARQYDVARRAVLRIAHQQRTATRRLAGAEVAFSIEVDQALLVGKVDRLEVDDDGRGVVVDYKTSSTKVGGRKIQDHPQLALYQVATERGAFPGVSASGGAELVQLRSGDGEVAPVERQPALDDRPGLREATLELLATVTSGVLAEEFPARPGTTCDRCVLVRCCPAQAAGEQVLS